MPLRPFCFDRNQIPMTCGNTRHQVCSLVQNTCSLQAAPARRLFSLKHCATVTRLRRVMSDDSQVTSSVLPSVPFQTQFIFHFLKGLMRIVSEQAIWSASCALPDHGHPFRRLLACGKRRAFCDAMNRHDGMKSQATENDLYTYVRNEPRVKVLEHSERYTQSRTSVATP